jgi:hypothetical protein
MNRGARFLLLMAAAIASAWALMLPATASAATASAATGPTQQPVTASGLQPSGHAADGTPIYHLTSRTAQPLASAHACTAPNNDGTTQAVFCADVIGYSNGNGTATIYPQAEGICQNLANRSNFPQCANITLVFGLWAPGPQELSGDWGAECGHSFGPCPTPRYIVDGGAVGVDGCTEVWTVVDAGSVIELPVSAKFVSLPANLGSGHIIVCP